MLAAPAAVTALLLAACGGGSDTGSQSDTSGSASKGGTSSGATQSVSLQLDWTPNTSHTGFYVAENKGYYEEAGIKLDILPYSESEGSTIVGSGNADCGIVTQESVVLAVAAGSRVLAVMPIFQHQVEELIVNKDSDFKRPKDLSGATYGGFGAPYEVPMVDQMVEYDGGQGEVKNVILNTGAYEAVYHGQVDTSLAFRNWEVIQAEEEGIELRAFRPQDYGVPDSYTKVLICNPHWLEANPELAQSFVEATAKGFEYAVENPTDAAKILVEENPSAFPSDQLVYSSAKVSAQEYVDADGKVGCNSEQRWTEVSNWLSKQGILVDPNGNPMTSPPPLDTLFSSEYEPKGCAAGA
ncbi:MAG: ABC transporter substrate-binding protein [Actinobacteria bacterium]|nr:ABC transporter substrate-binding protein [Actinomycetota bacterium]